MCPSALPVETTGPPSLFHLFFVFSPPLRQDCTFVARCHTSWLLFAGSSYPNQPEDHSIVLEFFIAMSRPSYDSDFGLWRPNSSVFLEPRRHLVLVDSTITFRVASISSCIDWRRFFGPHSNPFSSGFTQQVLGRQYPQSLRSSRGTSQQP